MYPPIQSLSSSSSLSNNKQLQLQQQQQKLQHQLSQTEGYQLSQQQIQIQLPLIMGNNSNDDNNSNGSSGNNINGGYPGNSALSPVSRLPTSKLPTQFISINVSPLQSPHSEGDVTPNNNSNSKMNRLDLEGTHFTYFPFKVDQTKLVKLPRLLLGKNYKIDFDRCYINWAAFRSLKVLSLDHCQLNRFPTGVCNIPSLRRLNLKKNQIQTIPGEIKKLTKLKRIDLSHNQVDSIPNEVAELALLKSININSNRFKTGQSVTPLSFIATLEKISLNHNQLTEFPSCFLALPLHTLYLDHNEIPEVPPEVKQWKTLRDFSINNNIVKRVNQQQQLPIQQTAQLQIVQQQPQPQQQLKYEKLHVEIPRLQSISIANNQSDASQVSNMMEQMSLSPHSASGGNEPLSPSQTPLSPSRKPPKPLPLPPSMPSLSNNNNNSSNNNKSRLSTSAIISPTRPTSTNIQQQPITSTSSSPIINSETRPKVPPLKLSKNSLSVTTSIPNNINSLASDDNNSSTSMMSSSISNDHLSKLATAGNNSSSSNLGLGARVRSFTSYEYSMEQEKQLMHTTSSSSGDSWQDDDIGGNHQDLVSPNSIDNNNNNNNNYTKPSNGLSKSTSAFTSPRGHHKEKKSSKIFDFFALAKGTLTAKLKNPQQQQQQVQQQQSQQQQQNNSKIATDSLTPRNSNGSLINQCTSSPSTPRPSFPERNGSNSSLANIANTTTTTSSCSVTPSDNSPTPRKRDRKLSNSFSNNNINASFIHTKDQPTNHSNNNNTHGSVISSLIRHSSHSNINSSTIINNNNNNNNNNNYSNSYVNNNINHYSNSSNNNNNNNNNNSITHSHSNSNQHLSHSVNPVSANPILFVDPMEVTYEDTLKNMSYSSGGMGAHFEMVSHSMPMTSSILLDTSNRDDVGLTESTVINRSSSSSSAVSSSYRKSPPISDQQPTPVAQKLELLKQSKLEFVEEINVDDKSLVIPPSNSKKRLTALVLPTKPNHGHSGSISTLLVPAAAAALQTRKSLGGSSDPSKRKLKKREESGGVLRESTSTGNLTSSIYLEGDDFIRDLMASPVINVDIEFTSEDGVPKIKAATLKMLVNALSHEKGHSKELENMFFDTYMLFTNVDTLIQLLSERFYHTGKNNSPIIKQKVLRFVQRWVDRNWEDFNEKQSANLLEFCKTCQETVEQGMPTSTYSIKNQITSLTNIIKMRRDGTYVPDEDQESWEQPPIPDFIYQENFTLLDLKSHEIARQLSIIDQSLIIKITKHELLDYVQSQSNPPQSIVNVTNRFNYISRWVASEITTCYNLDKRIMLIFKFINIALNCWVLKNFNSAIAIIAGMKHGAVLRLKSTWFYINNSKANAIFQEFEEMISPTSLSKLRKIMDSVEPPAVPYLGSYFNHLVGITEGNKSTKSSDQINLLKYEMLSKILQRVHLIQSKTYNLASVGVIQKFLNELPQLTEAQLYESVSKLDSSRDLSAETSKLRNKKRKGTIDEFLSDNIGKVNLEENDKKNIFFEFLDNNRFLRFNDSFYDKDIIPPTVTTLQLAKNYNEPIEKDLIPNHITTLIFGDNFDQKIAPNSLPDIIYLRLWSIWNLDIDLTDRLNLDRYRNQFLILNLDIASIRCVTYQPKWILSESPLTIVIVFSWDH
ncbi:Ras guanine nucleotide exchange factor [Heterostelium album PN500]|uniref:Ras guanine nucleotide exchange factor n=1 Tax=Heterostelium pallidum (strain ATCC 26659 / Pp 5 / PN500) TaxID=670386 RepID=D3BR51_HETP5|nr:Ras guanine nucleotide exchange factor [Heterostelium album PN500]EFA75883.1 Ras guanine nucleotide exchange factor [Heterostelium album PN500]|eukprot:XP_020428017.1 Ras guanine nucleotide exchange factor [Heterostelium album PN500]